METMRSLDQQKVPNLRRSQIRTKYVHHCAIIADTICLDVQGPVAMTDMFRIPKLAETADGNIVVTHWGQASSLLLRVGDRLVVNENRPEGLLVLCPNGWGNPMLGRRSSGQLLAEPSGAPASPLRWAVAGSVEAIERDLERGGIGPGRWYVAVRVESSDIEALTKARALFAHGWMDAAQLDELCRKAAVAPELAHVSVAVAAAHGKEEAEALLVQTKASKLRFEVRPTLEPRSGFGVVLEGPWGRLRDAYRQREAIGPAGRRTAGHRSRMAVNGSMVQLSLFKDSATTDG